MTDIDRLRLVIENARRAASGSGLSFFLGYTGFTTCQDEAKPKPKPLKPKADDAGFTAQDETDYE